MKRVLTLALPLALLSCLPPALSQEPSLTGDCRLIAVYGTPTIDRVILGMNSDDAVTIRPRSNGYWLGRVRRIRLMGPETACPVLAKPICKTAI